MSEQAPDWTEAKCREVDAELFFSPDGERANSIGQRLREAEARAVCLRCPVKADCLQYAVDTKQVGVWGATTDSDREVITRAAKNAARRASRAEA